MGVLFVILTNKLSIIYEIPWSLISSLK